MNIDLPLILVTLTIISGIIYLLDFCFWEKHREAAKQKQPLIIEYARSFFPVFLIVLVIRSFLFQAYRVPSGSLAPTVRQGDFLLVGQYAYGLRLPVTGTKILNIGEPHVGDIAVFLNPPNPKITLVKRIVGVPGDHVVYKNRVLTINGVEAKQTVLSQEDYDGADFDGDRSFKANVIREELPGKAHEILNNQAYSEDSASYDVVVPKGYYFAMGDNRDDSDDSRMWGFAPEKNLIGKAYFIIFSWDPVHHRIRFSRIGTRM
jgi:signal peptidase I